MNERLVQYRGPLTAVVVLALSLFVGILVVAAFTPKSWHPWLEPLAGVGFVAYGWLHLHQAASPNNIEQGKHIRSVYHACIVAGLVVTVIGFWRAYVAL